MNPLDLQNFRRQSYGHAMSRVLQQCERLGVANLWDTDLRRSPSVRAGALSGDTGRLAVAIDQAAKLGADAGFRDAVALLLERRGELRELEREAAAHSATVEVIVLDDDWGRKGRGNRIIAAIRADKLTASDVARRFQLALSTAKRYVQRAKK